MQRHFFLWEVAISYLSYCPTQGRHFMCSLVERVPLTTSTKALKLIRLCQRYEMTEEAQSICRVLARRCYGDGRMGSALTWCIKGQDATFAAFLAEKYFDFYESIGEFGDLSILDYLGDAVLLSNRLAFLSKYRDFHKQYSFGNYEAAGQLLVSLLTSGITLKKYWLTLLTDSIPLLQIPDKCVFSSADTYELLHILQEIDNTSSYSDQKDMITSQDEFSINKISLLRLALVRNLQSSLVLRERKH
uniref:Nuclear pore complex protein Nup85 n=1 Tax=Amphimedon queenslandica TaxID=400682 RepID=A0A1X7TC90_AMPQE